MAEIEKQKAAPLAVIEDECAAYGFKFTGPSTKAFMLGFHIGRLPSEQLHDEGKLREFVRTLMGDRKRRKDAPG